MNNLQQVSDIKVHLREVLKLLGEDHNRNGLKETPERWAKALIDATSGGEEEALRHLKFFSNESKKAGDERGRYTGAVEINNIEFHSTCEHHLLPFFGHVNITYLPDPKRGILGLSKFPRIVDAFARTLNNQERLTGSLTDFLYVHVSMDVSVEIVAEHACVCSRGVKKAGMLTRTFEASSPLMLRGELQTPG